MLAQKLLSNHKMAPMETLYFISPLVRARLGLALGLGPWLANPNPDPNANPNQCVVWMVPFILLELPVALKHDSFSIATG